MIHCALLIRESNFDRPKAGSSTPSRTEKIPRVARITFANTGSSKAKQAISMTWEAIQRTARIITSACGIRTIQNSGSQ